MVWHSWTLLSMFLAVASVNGNTSPQFNMSSIFRVPEDTRVGAWLFKLVAVDADQNDTLVYSIRGTEAYYFSVNSSSGDVILKQTLDYEKTKTIIIDAVVKDNFNAEVSKKLTIIVEDRNDNKPVFEYEPYFTDVLENTTVGSPIYTVLAKDADTGSAGRVSYSIEDVIPDDVQNHNLFYILYNGTVVLNGSLSYNNKSTFYRIKILAKDGGGLLDGQLVHQNNTAYLSVTVVDVADLDPQFLGEPYAGSVPENCALGTSVVTVRAIDRDKEVNDIIYYNITNPTNLFRIDRITGVITVSGNLDREGDPGEQVQLQVVAREKNLNIYQQVAQVSTIVTIQITDINDNIPQFYSCRYPACNFTAPPESNFLGYIEEHASARTPVDNLTIVAYDPDKGSNGTFQLSLRGPDAFAFSVSPQQIVNVGTVQVLVSNSSLVDYEKTHTMIVEIVANDTGRTTDCCSYATVTIDLVDINDHRPEFSQSDYKLYVLEDSPAGTIVSPGITATDPDSGKFGEITYELLPQSVQSTFTVNATTGAVLVANGSKLDWGTRSTYYATLQAVDGGGLSGSTQLEISVIDINNNPPVVIGSYNIFVTEGKNIDPVKIQATDQDDPNTNNSRLQYEIMPGEFSSNFTINPDTGKLSSNGPLDREAIPAELNGVMVVTVLVHDLGIPQLNTTVNVTITVEDINDNAPRFESSFYEFSVQEGLPGISVGNVTATDADQTEINNRITFNIGNSQDSSKFLVYASQLGPGWYQGNLWLKRDIALDYDRLQEKFFDLTMQAENSDFGGAVETATATVRVNVLDINDEPPSIIPSPPHDIEVLENITLHELVETLNATDLDANSSLVFQELAVACFKNSANAGHRCRDWFHLEPNGSLYVTSSGIDYETCDLVELTLRVKDEFTEVGDPYSRNETLRIKIVDVNDNPPLFLPVMDTFVVIPEISLVKVAEVKAKDRDSGVNCVITFAISKVVFIPDNGPKQTLTNLFKVVTTVEEDIYVGSIQVASNLDKSLKGRYQLMVEAKDHGTPPLSSSTSLDIFTVDQSYRVTLRFSTSLQDVQTNLEKIKAALFVATQATFYMASIKSIEESSNSRSKRAQEKTVMEAYFVISNGTALTGNTVRTLIQENDKALAQLLSLGLLIITDSVEPTNTSKELLLFGIIVGLAGAGLLLLIILILTVMGMRKSYGRKIKALKALKVASTFSAKAMQQGPAIPGTNKYNTEGANPVLGFSLDPSMDLGFEDNSSVEVASLNSLDENTVDAPESGPATVLKLGRVSARWQADGWEEPLEAALESHSRHTAENKPQQLRPPKEEPLSFTNSSLDTTDL
ncbi:cadherin-related family member 2 [Hemicordylus capensis]|uniref:cadherin-related family member 2 n=1 Tax=Hemicordylus capensis TaxID=884348 RepID=UPI002302A630|nr:cadherin-related family member 2 [Hemicordylus capensis]XP_053144893.1 cadherin-related family member 2 [Hemicordylus capensis]